MRFALDQHFFIELSRGDGKTARGLHLKADHVFQMRPVKLLKFRRGPVQRPEDRGEIALAEFAVVMRDRHKNQPRQKFCVVIAEARGQPDEKLRDKKNLQKQKIVLVHFVILCILSLQCFSSSLIVFF